LFQELERTHALFCKERDKEKFQQRSLQNRLNHILNGTDSLENLRQEDLSSPSTDTGMTTQVVLYQMMLLLVRLIA